MNPVEKVLSVARAELGYHEKNSNYNLDDKTANSGSSNFTKYARDLDALGYFYNGPKQGYPYCDVGVDWCFVKAFGVETALKLLCQPKYSTGAGCLFSAQFYKQKGQFYQPGVIPRPGDQIFFMFQPGEVSHTGLVESVTGSTVTVIEFNASDQVARRTYTVGQACIYGYGRPDWSIIDNNQGDFSEDPEPAAQKIVTNQTIEGRIFNFCLESLHINLAAACGVLANIEKESGFILGTIGDNGTSYGICQWHASRRDALMSWCGQNGHDYKALEGQLAYLKHELETTHRSTYNALKDVEDTQKGAYEAAKAWCIKFEVPANKEEKAEDRGNIAMYTYWPRYGGGKASQQQGGPQSPASSIPANGGNYAYDNAYKCNMQVKILKQGMTGPGVKSLQQLLTAQGFSVGSAGCDGEFGSDTCAAVIAFQTENALEADAEVGPTTLKYLIFGGDF